MIRFKNKKFSENDKELFLDFICRIEGWKTKCKNLHWSAPKKNIHVYLDEFLNIISGFQDTLAEGYMGILGKMDPSDVVGIPCNSTNAWDFIDDVIQETTKFYNRLPDEVIFVGIKSETETLIQNENKYKYLFNLCLSDKNFSELKSESMRLIVSNNGDRKEVKESSIVKNGKPVLKLKERTTDGVKEGILKTPKKTIIYKQ